jgi:homoserine O-succinyltransferase
MPLSLPPGHPLEALAGRPPPSGARDARIGVINVMPGGEVYERMLGRALAGTSFLVEPRFIRLRTHAYKSTDHAHLDRWYRTYDEVLGEGRLDGLILTGAPIEHLPLAEVRYWPELRGILERAQREGGSTLGLCWGAIALADLVGIGPEVLRGKLFGVFPHAVLSGGGTLLGADPVFTCPHSRHAGLRRADLDRALAADRVSLLAEVDGAGPAVFATRDHRLVAHLGHPEYEAERLAFEWRRDRHKGRADVPEPTGLDVERPSTTWASHTATLFERWIGVAVRNARDGSAHPPVAGE